MKRATALLLSVFVPGLASSLCAGQIVVPVPASCLAHPFADSVTDQTAADLGLSREALLVIGDSYLIRDLPSPDEPPELICVFLAKGPYANLPPGEYLALLEEAVRLWPSSRLAHQGLGLHLLAGDLETLPRPTLRRAADELLTAAEIGFGQGRSGYAAQIADLLARLGDVPGLDHYFGQALAQPLDENERYVSYLWYADALGRAGNERAESYFQRAIETRPEGVFEAYELYTAYLFRRDQPQRVLDLLTPSFVESTGDMARFYRLTRCKALTQLGRDPQHEPDCAPGEPPWPPQVGGTLPPFEATAPGDATPTAPAVGPHLVTSDDCRYRYNPPQGNPPGCAYHPQDPNPPGYRVCYNYLTWNLAELMTNEAGGEARGSRSAVAWTVRNRVRRGSTPACGAFPGATGTCTSGCPAPHLPTTCAIQKSYCCVIHSGAFVSAHSPVVFENLDRAYRVIEGALPDPVSGYVPQGASCSLNSCDGTSYCSRPGGSLDFAPNGPIYFYANFASSYRCRADQPGISTACNLIASETCGNSTDGSGSDNCYGRATRERTWTASALSCGSGCTTSGTAKRLTAGGTLSKVPTESPAFKAPGGKEFLLEVAREGTTNGSVRVQLFSSEGFLLHDFGTQSASSSTYTTLPFRSSGVVGNFGITLRVTNAGPGTVLVRKVTARD